MTGAPIYLLVTDRNLQYVGAPIYSWTNLDVVGRFNEPSTGSFTAPADPGLLDQIQPGNRVIVIRDGHVLIAGPIEKPGQYEWTADDGGTGQVTVNFADDLALICGRIAYPDPFSAATAQTVDTWTATEDAESLMRLLVTVNAIATTSARQIPSLALGPVSGVTTPTISITARFDMLGDVLRAAAVAGGGLGFRTVQVGTQIQFEVYLPSDRSAVVRFSAALGSLRSVTYDPEAPSATVAIVGGQGQGATRTIREVVDADAVAKWWRLETFVDQRQTNINAELDAAGAAALAEAGEQARLATVTVDTDQIKFGRDYDLGDTVTVEIYPGVEVTDVVRSYHLQATPDAGEILTAIVGSQAASHDPRWLQVGRDLYRRLGRLERT